MYLPGTVHLAVLGALAARAALRPPPRGVRVAGARAPRAARAPAAWTRARFHRSAVNFVRVDSWRMTYELSKCESPILYGNSTSIQFLLTASKCASLAHYFAIVTEWRRQRDGKVGWWRHFWQLPNLFFILSYKKLKLNVWPTWHWWNYLCSTRTYWNYKE